MSGATVDMSGAPFDMSGAPFDMSGATVDMSETSKDKWSKNLGVPAISKLLSDRALCHVCG